MSYLLVGALVLLVVYGGAARRHLLGAAKAKLVAGVFAAMAFAAAGFVLLRGGWGDALALAALGAALTGWARWPRPRSPRSASGRSASGRSAWGRPASGRPASGMSASEARATLGVGQDASVDEIKAAYARLIQRVHPDRGGAAGLAAHLNLARDVLLKP